MTIKNQDELKARAQEAFVSLHRLMTIEEFDAAYEMIDEQAPLKEPKEEAVGYLQRIVAELGALNNLTLNRDDVIEDEGSIRVRQDYTVEYEKDTTDSKRYELLTWRVQPDGTLKLWIYINSKGED